jgi:hypothetical protein
MANNNGRYGLIHGQPPEGLKTGESYIPLRDRSAYEATQARKAKLEAAKQKAKARRDAQKTKPIKKKVKPANWEQMLADRPKTPLTPKEYFEKIR